MKMPVVSMSYLLEAGVHFGHQTKRWNPKMKEYIFTSRDDIYIIDLQKTVAKIEEAYAALKEIAQNGGKVIFAGTKKQASESVEEEAKRSDSYYVSKRWLGGTLTNFRTIRKRIGRLDEIEQMEKDGTFDKLPKKEVVKIHKEYDKLNSYLCGLRAMKKLPQAMIIVDPKKEYNAICEAHRLGIPVFGLVDTNCDPDVVDYVIPGNDDAIRAVKLIISVMANAIVEANGGTVIDYASDDKQTASDIMQKAVESVKKKEDRPRFDRDNNDRRNDRNGRRPFNRDNRDNREHRDFREHREFKKDVKIEQHTEKVEAKPEVKEQPKKAVVDLSTKTVGELRDMAKAKEVKGYSTMKKAELLEALK